MYLHISQFRVRGPLHKSAESSAREDGTAKEVQGVCGFPIICHHRYLDTMLVQDR